MSTVRKWLYENKLALNWDKTNYMIFGNLCKNDSGKNIIDDAVIKRVKETKFLGVILDEKLNWKGHVDYIKKKISQNIGILNLCKDVL